MKEFDLAPNELIKSWSAAILRNFETGRVDMPRRKKAGKSWAELWFGQIPFWIQTSYRIYKNKGAANGFLRNR